MLISSKKKLFLILRQKKLHFLEENLNPKKFKQDLKSLSDFENKHQKKIS